MAANPNGNGGFKEAPLAAETNTNGNGLSVQRSKEGEVSLSPSQSSNLPSWVDEACHGKGSPNSGLVLSILAVIGTLVAFVSFTG